MQPICHYAAGATMTSLARGEQIKDSDTGLRATAEEIYARYFFMGSDKARKNEPEVRQYAYYVNMAYSGHIYVIRIATLTYMTGVYKCHVTFSPFSSGWLVHPVPTDSSWFRTAH